MVQCSNTSIENLPPSVIGSILRYVPDSYFELIQVNHHFRNMLHQNRWIIQNLLTEQFSCCNFSSHLNVEKTYLQLKQSRVQNQAIIKLMGGAEAFLKIPILKWKWSDRQGGCFNFFAYEDLKYPVMRGVDSYGRPFIAFRLEITGGDRGVCVFFRRYIQCFDLWHHVINGLSFGQRTILVWGEDNILNDLGLPNRLQRLFRGEQIGIAKRFWNITESKYIESEIVKVRIA